MARLAHFLEFLETGWLDLSEAPVVESRFEEFEEGSIWGNRDLRLTSTPNCRFQFRNPTGDRMVQLQRTRFLFNWMGKGEEYPRFGKVFESFRDHFERLNQFLRESEIEPVRLNQWEVTYLNDIPKGTLWNSPNDWGFLRLFAPPICSTSRFETFSGNWRMLLAGDRGRLHIDWQHAKRESSESTGENGQEVVRLNLTARGPASDECTLLEGLSFGHQSIIEAFSDMTTERAHQFWERDDSHGEH